MSDKFKKVSELPVVDKLEDGDYLVSVVNGVISRVRLSELSADLLMLSDISFNIKYLMLQNISRSKIYSGFKDGWVKLFSVKKPTIQNCIVLKYRHSAYNSNLSTPRYIGVSLKVTGGVDKVTDDGIDSDKYIGVVINGDAIDFFIKAPSARKISFSLESIVGFDLNQLTVHNIELDYEPSGIIYL